MFMDVLSGRDDTPAKKSRLDVALANAGALIYLAGLADALPEGTETARRTVKSGAALKLLKEFASYTWSEKSAVIS